MNILCLDLEQIWIYLAKVETKFNVWAELLFVNKKLRVLAHCGVFNRLQCCTQGDR